MFIMHDKAQFEIQIKLLMKRAHEMLLHELKKGSETVLRGKEDRWYISWFQMHVFI
jgi:hypothetical protein